jgi:hypothetical protein
MTTKKKMAPFVVAAVCCPELGLCGSRMVHDWTTRDTPDDGKTATRIMSHVES